MLLNILLCLYAAAVRANKFDLNIAREHAEEILTSIKIYIDHHHSNLSSYVRYELNHENTYDGQLLKCIINHYENDCQDENMKQSFIDKARDLGGNEDTATEYASMHLIMFKDIINRNSFHLLFHPVNDVENNRVESLFNCIITIGGSVEKRFDDVRYAIEQLLKKQNNYDNYHFPLSIRMLSDVGQTAVYYHKK